MSVVVCICLPTADLYGYYSELQTFQPEMADYKLYYFNARGRGEPIRQLLALGHQKYRDIRFEWGNEPENEWKEYKQGEYRTTVILLVSSGGEII